MNFKRDDYFSELYISLNKRFGKEDVENKYELIESEAKKTENNIYDETIRKKSPEQKMEQLNKLNKCIEEIEKLVNQNKVPEVEKNKKCKRCAYYDYCYL